jgi:PAS domain S-box-containing protein
MGVSDLQEKISELEKQLAIEKKINKILIDRIESEDLNTLINQVHSSSNYYLKESIIEKNLDLENINNELNSLLTKKERVEYALKLSETRFKAFFEIPIVGFVITDVYGNFIQFNDKFANIFGYTKEELKDKGFRFLQNEITFKSDFALFDHLHKGFLDSLTIERIFYKKNGEPISVELSLRVFFDQSTNQHYFGGILQDLTEKKKAEEKRKNIENRLQRFIENSPTFICAFNTDFEINYVNPALCKFMKLPKEEILGKKFYDFIKLKSNKDYAIFRIKNLTPENPSETHDQMFIDPDGETKWQQWTNIAFFDNEGNVVDYHSLGIDITDRKLFETQIILAKENAERSEKMKLAFLTQISHEIRTPVSTILNYLSLIKEYFIVHSNKQTKDYLTYFNIIDNSAERLIRTIDLILNLSELQTNSYSPNFGYLDVDQVLKNIFLLHEQDAIKKGLEYKYQFNLSEKQFFTDEYAFSQIFDNLISNAIKFTQQGSVIITVSKTDEISFTVSVKDTGIGISEEYKKIIYTPFSQEDSGYNRAFAGNGLGLALTKLYVDVTNAEISFESKKGVGTEFKVRFFW